MPGFPVGSHGRLYGVHHIPLRLHSNVGVSLQHRSARVSGESHHDTSTGACGNTTTFAPHDDPNRSTTTSYSDATPRAPLAIVTADETDRAKRTATL